jgi:alpha-N-arabinofuranosidase
MGINYITVRGFTLRDAATPWAPPTAEQIGLIGTHWSKGWVIENNVISHSRCSGIALGKYGDAWDNKSQSAEGYNRTIQSPLKNGWTKENIG